MSLESGVKRVVGELYKLELSQTGQGEKLRLLARRGRDDLARRLAPRVIDQGCEPIQFFEPCRSLQLCPRSMWRGRVCRWGT